MKEKEKVRFMSLFTKRYLFFGGKGGVGKTTIATATAIKAADLAYRTLLVSTDPAHSVSDRFGRSYDVDNNIHWIITRISYPSWGSDWWSRVMVMRFRDCVW
jgi:hypothetical protein